MKRIVFFLLLILMTASVAWTQTAWTVRTVPNTRLQSNDIHVSDPDGYLSDSTEMSINTALCAIRDKADVFLVTLTSIGDAEPKHFATELFNYWGIGDTETDNGVLLLFVEDQHALEFETGYGAEETLTDARCERIFTKTIVPYFKAGDYEGGLCAGVADIVSVYGGEIPMGLKTTLPEGNDEDEELGANISYFFGFFALLLMAMPIVGISFWIHKRKAKKGSASDVYKSTKEEGVTYIDQFKSEWSGSPWEGKGCLGGMMLGLSIYVFLFFAVILVGVVIAASFPEIEEKRLYNWTAIVTLFFYFTWICFRQNQRTLKTAKKLAKQTISPKSVYKAAFEHTSNKIAMWMAPWLGWIYYLIYKKRIEQSDDCTCPECGGAMKKYAMFDLPELHAAEERVEALKFTPYCCGNGHVIVVKEHGKQYSKYKTCSKCGAYTLKLTQSQTLVNADYSHNGEKEETYECQHCGETLTKTVMIPKKVHYSGGSSYSSSSSSGRSYSSHSSSHSSGGSFGGGHSGGGGYSGKW